MNIVEELAGELCKILLPIEETVYFGNSQSNISVCTLSSIDLLKELANSPLMDKIAVAGRLLSENKGIDSLVRYVVRNPKITTLILCGKETIGHSAGHSLICLYESGLDYNNRIVGSQSPYPMLSISKDEVLQFQRQLKIINRIGNTSISELEKIIETN